MIFSYFNYLLYINSSFTLNLKTAISKHSKDELILNSAFSDLEDFYNTIVLPPPPRKPKGIILTIPSISDVFFPLFEITHLTATAFP